MAQAGCRRHHRAVGCRGGAGAGHCTGIRDAREQHENGIVQDVAAIGRLCRERRVLFHVDAARARAGYRSTSGDPDRLAVPLRPQLYGPKGIGPCSSTEHVRRVAAAVWRGSGARPATRYASDWPDRRMGAALRITGPRRRPPARDPAARPSVAPFPAVHTRRHPQQSCGRTPSHPQRECAGSRGREPAARLRERLSQSLGVDHLDRRAVLCLRFWCVPPRWRAVSVVSPSQPPPGAISTRRPSLRTCHRGPARRSPATIAGAQAAVQRQ